MTVKRNAKVANIRRIRILSLLVGCAVTTGVASAATATSESWVPGRLLVQPNPGLPDAELVKILKAQGAKSVGKIAGINVHVVQLPSAGSEKAVASLLSKNPHLKFAERDMYVQVTATANDPYYSSAWHLPKVGAPAAWDLSSGQGVTIAILDTGVDGTHPDLAPNMVSGWNFFDNNTDTHDVHGHGTKVAGTAAAATNNSVGVSSMAGSAHIMPLRIADSTGYATYSMIASGVTWASDHGADVANISIDGVAGSSTVLSAAQYMKKAGGLVVAGSGNSGTQQSISANTAIISVSATDSNDAITSWSSYGSYVDLAAPGAGIWTATMGGGYGAVSGTSFSGPVVAGTIALVKAANPALAPTDIENILYSTAVDLGAAGYDMYYGYGRVDAGAAVKSATTVTLAKDTTAPSVSITSPGSGASVAGLVTIGVSASDNVGVSYVDLMVNGAKLATDSSSPYSFSWDSTTAPNGNASVTAYAYDAAGNYSTSSVTVNVANTANTADTTAPTATISNPGNGSKVSGSVSVGANARDNVGVKTISLYIDGVLKATANGSSVSYNWNTRKASTGPHTIQVQATDVAGNMGSESIQVSK